MQEQPNAPAQPSTPEQSPISEQPKESTALATEISMLATETFKALTNTMFDEAVNAVTAFSRVAEKGTIIFLQSVGAVLICLAVVLAWRSESIFESLTNNFVQLQRTNSKEAATPGTNSKEAVAPDFKVQFGSSQFLILVSSGTMLILGGSLLSVITYKWRIDSFRMAQNLDKESLALQVALRQSGIKALTDNQKALIVASGESQKALTEAFAEGQKAGAAATATTQQAIAAASVTPPVVENRNDPANLHAFK